VAPGQRETARRPRETAGRQSESAGHRPETAGHRPKTAPHPPEAPPRGADAAPSPAGTVSHSLDATARPPEAAPGPLEPAVDQAWMYEGPQWPEPPGARLLPGWQPPRADRARRQRLRYAVAGLVCCLVALAAVGGFIVGRKTAPHPVPARTTGASRASSTAPAAPTAGTAAAPVTAVAVRTTAIRFFRLYATGRYPAAYLLLAPMARHRITEATWVAVHQQCQGAAGGRAYQVGQATLTGRSAVLTVTRPGTAAQPGTASTSGSGEATFVYRGGQWRYVPPDLPAYQGTPAQIVTRLQAAAACE
jgi:hypothetical protein